jgi:hypothetical protein
MIEERFPYAPDAFSIVVGQRLTALAILKDKTPIADPAQP